MNYKENTISANVMLQQGHDINLTTAEEISNLRAQEHWQKRGIDLNYQIQKNMNQVAYQRELSAIQIEETAQKAKVRADISLEKGLKHLEVMVLADGTLRLEQQRFGDPLQNILPFQIRSCKRFIPIFWEHPGILCVIFRGKRDADKSFWLDLSEVAPRTINRKFTALGLSFGFGGQKETQLRQLLIERAVQLSEKIELPQDHGWYSTDNGLQFAFPEELTWKEALTNAI